MKHGFNLIDTDDPSVEKVKLRRKDPAEERPKETIGCFFLDSGAHSLHNKYIVPESKDRFAFFRTKKFKKYVDKYAEFVKANIESIDYYANVDVIHNPELSWKVLKYLEQEHGLNPVPVIHMGTSERELERHLEAGYDYIGLGGVAQKATRTSHMHWLDKMFDIICSTPDRKPCAKTHGFALTAYPSLVRYPWWSVDSTTWAKAGGFGTVNFPKKLNGEFVFVPPDLTNLKHLEKYTPYAMSTSTSSPSAQKRNQSYLTLSAKAKNTINEWLDIIGIPVGSIHTKETSPDNPELWGQMLEWGIISHHAARKIANLIFFSMLTKALPDWPWAFNTTHKRDLWHCAKPSELRKSFENNDEMKKMILFYSGSTSGESLPERVLEKESPGVMLTYWEMHGSRGDTIRRFERHVERRKELLDA